MRCHCADGSNHACDCRAVPAAVQVDGVTLVAERRHVREKVQVALGQQDSLRLEGPGWVDRLEALLDELTFPERAALFAAPISRDGVQLTLSAQDAVLRVQSAWLPELFSKSGLYPHLQPIASLADGSTYGYESLIRGRVGRRELNGVEIVRAARAHGALFALDLIGRTVALEQAMPTLQPDQILFVNITPAAIYSPQTCLRSTWAIAEHLGLPLERVCFEIVETEDFPDLKFLQRIIDECRAQGSMVALDDLGAGHSSLSYLQRLRPDIVKIDRDLVIGVADDPARQRLLAALIDYSHELDIRVVAEGIETEDDLGATRALGADFAQGWYVGRPAAEPVTVDPDRITGARTSLALLATLAIRDRALTAATSGVVIADATQHGVPIIYVNPAFERLTGYTAAELRGRNCNVLQGEGTAPEPVLEMAAAVREGRECRVTLLNFTKDGTPFWCEVHLAPVRDARGQVVQYVGVQSDVSDRVGAELQLREQRDRADHLARHDVLTGLPNRQEFAEQAELSLEALSEDQIAALIFIDLNQFKLVNDRFGHATGDEVLRGCADELRRICGPDVLLGRQAGDEFIVMFTSTSADEAAGRAQQMTIALSEQVTKHHDAGVITASAGWCLSTPEQRATFDQMSVTADAAMYERKAARQQAATS